MWGTLWDVNTVGHLLDDIILLPRPECFIKMLKCYSDFSSLLGTKKQIVFKFDSQ